jgi:hypothetical protein
LTNTTTIQDVATNGRVSTVVAASSTPFNATEVRATLRKQPSGSYQAYLGYKAVGGSTWTTSAPVAVTTDDCGYSHNEVVFTFPSAVSVAPSGVEFAVFGYNGTATTTLQVNSISLIGSSAPFLINGTTGINNAANNDIQLYPNPVTNILNVIATEKVNVAIFSIDGKKLMGQKDAKNINVSNLVSGMYLIQVYGENNNLLKTEKFIKK